MMKEKLRAALAAALVLVLAVSAVMVARRQAEYRRMEAARQEAERIAGLPSAAPTATPRPTVRPTPEPEPEPTPPPLPEEAAALAEVDLDALRAVNGDVAGWILIPGTELSYPVVQGGDNQYYLDHNWKKEPSSGGAVFLESTCAADLSDFHTIVYAHRMNNDTMFGTLKYYDGLDFWREHPSVYLAAGDGVYRYDIFSAEEAGVRSIVYRLDLVESALQGEFVRSCADNSQIDTGIVPDPSGRFLTLSTCTAAGGPETRWVVHGCLAQEYRLPAGAGDDTAA